MATATSPRGLFYRSYHAAGQRPRLAPPRTSSDSERRPHGRYYLRLARGIVKAAATGFIQQVPSRVLPGRRGRVTAFSQRSRSRMYRAAAEAIWPRSQYLLVTLTYPGAVPGSWVKWKRDLATLRKRWERVHGPMVGLWAMEFQRRGAVHFHLVVLAPRARLPWFRRWLSQGWYTVVGSGDERHLRAGTNVVEADSRGASRYVMTELGKRFQKELPACRCADSVLGHLPGCVQDGAGRWWGLWRVERKTIDVGLADRAAFDAARGMLWRLAAVNGFDGASRWYIGSVSTYGDDRLPPWSLAVQLVGYLGRLGVVGK